MICDLVFDADSENYICIALTNNAIFSTSITIHTHYQPCKAELNLKFPVTLTPHASQIKLQNKYLTRNRRRPRGLIINYQLVTQTSCLLQFLTLSQKVYHFKNMSGGEQKLIFLGVAQRNIDLALITLVTLLLLLSLSMVTCLFMYWKNWVQPPWFCSPPLLLLLFCKQYKSQSSFTTI